MDDNYKHPINEKKVKFRPNILGNKKDNKNWIFIITIVSFFLSATMSFFSSTILKDVNYVIAFCVLLIIIVIGIIFDIIGIAVTAADEVPFHAMASRKLYGAKQAIQLIRNANKVSSFCNDVVGDICGVISGTASALIVLRIFGSSEDLQTIISSVAMSGLVASVTIGGKAMGKTLAIANSNYIVYKVGVILKFVIGKLDFIRGKPNKR